MNCIISLIGTCEVIQFTYSEMVIAESIMTIIGFLSGWFLHKKFYCKQPFPKGVEQE